VTPGICVYNAFSDREFDGETRTLTFFTLERFGICEPGDARKANSHGLKLEAEVYSAKLKTKAERGFWRTPSTGEGIRQFSIKLLVKVRYNVIRGSLTIMHAVVCDFPLPCTPQTNAENGTLVLRNSLESMIVVEGVGSELPRSPYCGRSSSRPGDLSTSAEKSTAFL